jgi:chromate transporter
MKKDMKLLLKIFFAFFKIGAFTIGGGYAMLPIIEKEVVDKQKWVNSEEIVDVFAVVQSVPGVIAINSSIYVGYKICGISGAVAAALGVIIPSFITILAIAFVMSNIRENPYVQKAFTGIIAGVTALIGLTAVKLGKSVIKDKTGMVLAAASFIAIVVFDIHAIITIAAGAIIGYTVYGIARRDKSKN